MTVPADEPSRKPVRTRSTPASAVLIALGMAILTVAAILVSDGNVAVALAPVVAIAFLYLLAKVPMRYPVLVVLFLGLTLENPGDDTASGLWKSPLYLAGALLLGHWNLTVPVHALFFSGIDLLLVFFFGLAVYRRITASPLDRAGFVETASPLRFFGIVTICGALLIEVWGVLRGGMDFPNSLWQVQRIVYLPLLFFLFHYAFRGPRDQAAVGKAIILAACVRAAAAWGIRHFVTPNDIDHMPTATSHPDSMLFAGAFCLCVALFLELPTRKHLALCSIVLPILTMGMIANNRRLVWVEIALALLVLFFVMPMTKVKRRIVRWTVMGIPAFLLYLVVGWSKQGGIFKGAALLRSIVDSKSDASTAWRDWENFDLVYTLKSSPIFGIGYGHPYVEQAKLSDVTQFYKLEKFVPHNSILGLWAYGGLVGFTLLWMFVVVGAFFAARSYKMATRRIDRAAALSCTLMLVIYLAHCYGDLALGTWASVFLVAAALSVSGKLALTTGAWPSRRRAVKT